MREILFRGKNKYFNEWAEGYYTKGFNRPENDLLDMIYSFSKENEKNKFSYTVVNPETVGQYTGLTDKNGKKIFEGDIVMAYFYSNRSYQKFRVIFKNGAFLFDNGSVEVPVWDIYCLRIIGNIHDNPELLKGGAE